MKVVVHDDHVGRLLADVGAVLAHSDADVGALQGDAVVDTVAGHADNIAGALQGLRIEKPNALSMV